MDEFNWCEQKGRDLFKIVLESAKVIEYEFSADKYSVWDVKYSTEKSNSLVEIKVRNQDYNKYPDWILEFKKYKALLAEIENIETTNKSVKAYYVNFFNDNYFCFWDLARINIDNLESMLCKATTARDSGYIWKDVFKLKISDAIFFGQIINNKVKNERSND